MPKNRWIRPPRVEVEWRDAWNFGGHGPVESIMAQARLARRIKLGFLVGQTEEVTVLAGIWDYPLGEDAQPEVDDIVMIPTGWVTKITYIDKRGAKGGSQKKEGPARITAIPENPLRAS